MSVQQDLFTMDFSQISARHRTVCDYAVSNECHNSR